MTDNKKTATQKIFLSVLYSVIVGVVIYYTNIALIYCNRFYGDIYD